MRARKTMLFLLGLLMVVSCARNPVTGKRQLALISEGEEIAIGQQSDPEIRAQFGVVEDPQVQAYLDRIGRKLAAVSHRPGLRWKFTVVDSPVINAMALPGGYVYFTRAILSYMNSEAEVAAVMGHEIGHVTYRHSVSQMSRAQLAGLGAGVGSIFSPEFRQLGGLAQTGMGLLFLKHGRDAERQSDEVGIEYAAKAGYDPRQASGFFTVLQRMGGEKAQAIPNWLSTHPDPGERVVTTSSLGSKWAAELGRRDFVVGRAQHLQHIDGLIFGENPREGFTEGERFLHPDLQFQIRLPRGWEVHNTRQALVAVSSDGRAVLQLSLVQAQGRLTPQGYAATLAQNGLRPINGRNQSINGSPAFVAFYDYQDSEGQRIQAQAAFIDYSSQLYQVIGKTSARTFSTYQSQFEECLYSFSKLTDSRALGVRPDRLKIIKVDRSQSVSSLLQRYAHARASVGQTALLNRLSLDEQLKPGESLKIVQSGR